MHIYNWCHSNATGIHFVCEYRIQYIHGAIPLLFISPCWFPFALLSDPLYLLGNPPSCEKIRPPWSPVACKLNSLFPSPCPYTPHSKIPTPPQGFSHPNIHLLGWLREPGSQSPAQLHISLWFLLNYNKLLIYKYLGGKKLERSTSIFSNNAFFKFFGKFLVQIVQYLSIGTRYLYDVNSCELLGYKGIA